MEYKFGDLTQWEKELIRKLTDGAIKAIIELKDFVYDPEDIDMSRLDRQCLDYVRRHNVDLLQEIKVEVDKVYGPALMENYLRRRQKIEIDRRNGRKGNELLQPSYFSVY